MFMKNIVIVVALIAIAVIGGSIFSSMSKEKAGMNNETTQQAGQTVVETTNQSITQPVAQSNTESGTSVTNQVDDMSKKDGAVMEKTDMMSKDTSGMADKKDTKDDGMTKDMVKGGYHPYASDKITMAESGKVVLFFHASWCPSCRSLSSDIESNLSAIPAGVHILKVDYDKEVELKKKYGVTNQHTLVQVNKEGTLITKWSGSPKLSSLLTQIK
jgi:thioredoxin 1